MLLSGALVFTHKTQLQSIPTYSGESIADITDFYKGILDKIHFELPMYSGFFVFL